MLQNKIAIITGASRGIGKSIALAFARNGASLVLTCLQDKEALNLVKAEAESLGAHVINIMGDVASNEFCDEVVFQALEAFGTVDILVNCAGTITRTSVEEMSNREWHHAPCVRIVVR